MVLSKDDSLSEGYVPSRLDSYLSVDGILQNLTWNDTRSRILVVPRPVWYWDDATWVMAASFIIFTMQTGFGMLESGIVSLKNEINITMKIVVAIVLGGLSYWAFGYGLSYGDSSFSNGFIALGTFSGGTWFVEANDDDMGPIFVTFLFQLSFATRATIIVSGAMAERCNFHAYCLFAILNTLVYCVPAHWIWDGAGFLYQLDVIDIAGSGAIHLCGGASAFVAAIMIGPRLGRWDLDVPPPMGSPTNALIGLFMLWFGWLGHNSGSTFGVTGNQWRLAAKAAGQTMVATFGGGMVAITYSQLQSGKIEVLSSINGILGALASIAATCCVVEVWEALLIGAVGSFLANITNPLLAKWRVDDAVGATCVHGFGGAWGLIAAGIFAHKDKLEGYSKHNGILHGGGGYLLGVQAYAVVTITIWASLVTFILLWTIDKLIPIRMPAHEELLGADFYEHELKHGGVGVSRAVSVLRHFHDDVDPSIETRKGNKGHANFIRDYYGDKNKYKTKRPSVYVVESGDDGTVTPLETGNGFV